MTRAKDISKIVTDANLSGTLDVAGELQVGVDGTTAGLIRLMDSGSVTEEATISTDANGGLIFGGNSGPGELIFKTSSGTERVRITSGGNVGIGTASPNISSVGKALTINTTSSAILELAQNGSRVANFYSDGTNASLTNNTNNALTFFTNNTEKMRITAAGYVAIGQTDVRAQLSIGKAKSGTGVESVDLLSLEPTGTFAIGDTANITFHRGSTTNARISCYYGDDNAAYGELVFSTRRFTTDALNEGFRLDNRGRVGIGTDSPAAKLDLKHNSASTHLRLTENTSGNWSAFGVDTSDNLRIYANNSERMRIDSSGNVLVGTTNIDVGGSVTGIALRDDGRILASTDGTSLGIQPLYGDRRGTNNTGDILMLALGGYLKASIGVLGTNNSANDGGITFNTISGNTTKTERMRIDSSGSLLIGRTNTDSNNGGHFITPNYAFFEDDGTSLFLNRFSSDGTIVQFRRQNSNVGSIGTVGSVVYIGSAESNLRFNFGSGQAVIPATSAGAVRDNVIDLGESSARFDDIYATNGTIQTSDQNEKQDIEELSEAEQRVAVVAKGLMRKFRWIDSVAEKGDNARTHFGIIAQDLQDAFTAEGLDASDYAMFTSNTWWEKEISVEAVEADEENSIEAKDAYTYIDTKEEATEGYTERTRLGVRYNQLLAFIISAI